MNNMRVGVDLVRVSNIADSLAHFGSRFLKRIFTENEIAYATSSPDACTRRLAARFAAKEAALKALRLADAGISWTDIEVQREPSGECTVQLHGKASREVAARGYCNIALSMSHEDDYATAVVIATINN
jgi:holo-[acyl-carrier protein] synthase